MQAPEMMTSNGGKGAISVRHLPASDSHANMYVRSFASGPTNVVLSQKNVSKVVHSKRNNRTSES